MWKPEMFFEVRHSSHSISVPVLINPVYADKKMLHLTKAKTPPPWRLRSRRSREQKTEKRRRLFEKEESSHVSVTQIISYP